jgi:hypothetical protein
MPRPAHSPDDTRPGHCLCSNPDPCPIVERAQAAAERIAEMKLGINPPGIYDWCIPFRDATKAPTDTGAIREALLSGHAWISWLTDDRLADDMRLMHGPPTSSDYDG